MSPPPLTDEAQLRLLRLLERNPQASQRALAAELGISLGKTNYCLRALVERGLVKARNFRDSRNKQAYAYFLTPRGIEEKARVTVRFLARKQREYVALKAEIDELTREVRKLTAERDRDLRPPS